MENITLLNERNQNQSMENKSESDLLNEFQIKKNVKRQLVVKLLNLLS